MLVNDESFKESLTYTRKSKGPFSSKKAWKNAYYKNKQLNNIINNIMMKYLIQDCILEKEPHMKESDPSRMLYVDEETKEILNTIFMLITDVDTDVCFVGQNLVTENLISYRMGTYPTFNTSNGKDFKGEALIISETLQSFINSIINGKLGKEAELREEKKFDQALANITKMVENYIEGGTKT